MSDPTGEVTNGNLNLRRLDLRTLPDLSKVVPRLTSLDLSGNRLRELPDWLWNAPRLQRLVLAGNRLTELPDSIRSLAALRELDASGNRLRTVSPYLKDCHELRRIDVSGNGLRDLTSFSLLPRLLMLDAADNRIAELATLPTTLTVLDLSGNDLATLPASFAQLHALRRLDLSGNRLTSRALGVLTELALEELYLDDNELDSAAVWRSVLRSSARGNPVVPAPADEELESSPPPLEPAEQVAEIIQSAVSGGPQPDLQYYDQPPYTFEVSLSVDQRRDTERVVDLYYKRFKGLPASVSFADGTQLGLSQVSRRTALEFVQEHQPSGTNAVVELAPTKTMKERGTAFLEQSVARLDRAELLVPGAGPHPIAQAELTPAARVLNVALTDPEGQVLPATRTLAAGRAYAVRIDVGPVLEDSLVINPVPINLDEVEPDVAEGYWFDVVVSSSDVAVASHVERLFLPLKGGSTNLSVPFTTGSQRGAASLRVTLYHRNNVVQSIRVDFAVDESGGSPGDLKGIVDFALTDDAAKAEQLPARQLNVLTNEGASGTHKVVVNNGDRAIAVTLTDDQATTVLTAVRKRLTEITLGVEGDRSQYGDDNRKRTADFVMDLRRLALSGAQLWQAVVPDVDDRRYLREHLRERASIQITRATRTTFPWALVYDIPRDPMEEGKLCPLLLEWDTKQAALQDYPTTCPDEASHGLNVICPYGFWGFRHLIEQPPSVRAGTLRTEIKVVGASRAATARSLALNRALTESHFTDLEACFAGSFEMVPCEDKDALQAALADPRLPLAYFYCHGKTEVQADVVTPYLEIGNDVRIAPGSLGAWHEAAGWGSAHWAETAPLVFINGCETASLTPSDVVSFVDAFAGLHAAGVVGTEIPVSQRVAGEVALSFYRQFAGPGNASAGTSLYRTRIDLLRKGNVAGLVYTPFCSMDLTLQRS